MPPLYRFGEVALYSLLSFLPFLLLAIYPFRQHFRFSRHVTTVIILSLTIIQIGLGLCASIFAQNYVALISAFSTFLYAVFYFFTLKVNWGKLLFTLLMISNVANCVVVCSKCIEGQLFGRLALMSYRWSFSLCTFGVELILILPLFFYMRNVYSPAMELSADPFMWKYMWLVPTTFYLIWYYALYGNISRSSLEIALRPANAIFLFILNLGAFLIHYVILRLVNEHEKNNQLLYKNHQLAMQTLQYENLSEKIIETRTARHDLRHHMIIMSGFLERNDTKNLKNYLQTYLQTFPDDDVLVYCHHNVLNTLFVYYAEQAKKHEIDFSINASLPAEIPIDDSHLSVLFGNLLENALDACMMQKTGKRQIILRTRIEQNSLILTLDNTFDGNVCKTESGLYQSTKHNGTGLGLISVKAIAEQYHGTFRAEQKNGMFLTSAILNFNDASDMQVCRI